MGYYDPPDLADPPCETCGGDPADCPCPVCPVCGMVGDPKCYREHGMEYTGEQLAGIEYIKRLQTEDAKRESDWGEQILAALKGGGEVPS